MGATELMWPFARAEGATHGRFSMIKMFKFLGIIVVIAVAVLPMTGCGTDPRINRGGWSEYTSPPPSSNFVVVGTVVIMNGKRATLLADLMEQAIELGAHDITYIRVGEASGLFRTRIRTTTALAIRYVEEHATDRDPVTICGMPILDEQGTYRIQIGSFPSVALARPSMDQLRFAGFSPEIEWFRRPPMYLRVFISSVMASEMSEIIQRLQNAGFEGIWIYKE